LIRAVDPMEAIKATFFQECEELLADLEAGLLALEGGDTDPETVNAVFRAVHSVKGGAGAFGLEQLVRFAHVFETTLDQLRARELEQTPHVLKVMLRAADLLADLVRAAHSNGFVDEARSQGLADELVALSGGAPAHAMEADGSGASDELLDDDFGFKPLQVAFPDAELAGESDAGPAAFDAAPMRDWQIKFRPLASLYLKANDPALVLRELERLGELEVMLEQADLPLLDDLDPEGAFLCWTLLLRTNAGEADIREAFEFVEGDCDLEITPMADATQDAAADEPASAGGEIDVMALIQRAQAEVAADAFAPAGMAAAASPSAPPTPVEEPAPVAQAAAPAKTAEPAAPVQTTIRVDLDRVDRLINLVGELVINQAMLSQRVIEAGLVRSSNVALGLDDLEQLTREIQDSVMAIRAQPVKSVFQRMPRLIREIAASTGKQVRLVTEGEGTEVDKTVIERLTDPITHMIRNAIDHGLEKPTDRLAAGKPAEGVVRLAAFHRSGRIVIEITDDGAGIDRKRVRDKAVEKGLVSAEAVLTDEETDNLLFMPGFSTASAISDISGRGVGMDVVKRSVQALGGRISIASRPGEGSTFTLSLPLTLAVLDGMVVTVDGQTLVAPLTAVVETLQPKTDTVRSLGPSGMVVAVRDAFVPLIDIGAALGFRSSQIDPCSGVALLVENDVGGHAALLVDAIQGQRQVVIKSLESNYQPVEGIAAATILGDGRVALILDVDAIIANRRREAPPPSDPTPILLAQAS
jgi:two-component system, chemotaxis family, sensor kinase CheA